MGADTEATAGTGPTLTVHDSTELKAAIMTLSAEGGGTVRVANGGEPYALNGFSLGAEGAQIHILPDNPGDPAVFTRLSLTDSRGLTFEGFTFDSRAVYEDRPGWQSDIDIRHSHDIALIGNNFISAADGLYAGDGTATRGESLGGFTNSTGITFAGNSVDHYYHGVQLSNVTDAVVSGNRFAHIQGDGIRLKSVQDVLVEGNVLRDFYGTTQDINHTDMIQIMAGSTDFQNTERVTIRDNLLFSGEGAATQSIFIRNETQAETGMAYRDISVINNLIYNGHQHGVTISGADGVEVARNTLLWDRDTYMITGGGRALNFTPVINIFESDVTAVTGNLVGGVNLRDVPAAVSENILLDYADTLSATAIGALFINAAQGGGLDLRDLSLLPGAEDVLAGSGVALSEELGRLFEAPGAVPGGGAGITAVLRQTPGSGAEMRVLYDAGFSTGLDGLLTPETAEIRWRFSDGVVLEGMQVERVFDVAGLYDVELTVITEAGRESIQRQTEIRDPQLLYIDFESGLSDASSYRTALDSDAGSFGGLGFGHTGWGFVLDGQNSLKIDRDAAQFEGLSEMSIALSLQRPEGGDHGLLLNRHGEIRAYVTEDGAFGVKLWGADGRSTEAVSMPGMLDDTDWHRIVATYDGDGPGLKLFVDGALAAISGPVGAVKATGAYDMVLGNQWGRDSLQGRIDDLSVTSYAMSAEAVDNDNFAFAARGLASGRGAGDWFGRQLPDELFFDPPVPEPWEIPDISAEGGDMGI